MLRSIITLLLVGLASPAFAQRAEAEQLFQDGDRLMAQAKLDEACAAFEGSNRIEPRAGTLIRLGECRVKNKQLASAWSAYMDALARVKDPRKRELAQAAVRSLAPRLSKLTIRSPKLPGLQITRNGEPVDEALWNRPVPVDGGRYEIVASAPGYTSITLGADVSLEAGNVTIDVPGLERPRLPKRPAPVAAMKPLPPPPRDEGRTFSTRRKVALGFAVVGVGSLAAGAVFGKQARNREDEAFALCPDPALACQDAARAQMKLDVAHTRALYSNVMFGVAAVAVVGATVLWVTGSPERVKIQPAISSQTVGLAVTGGF
jgi:hypothetical protein